MTPDSDFSSASGNSPGNQPNSNPVGTPSAVSSSNGAKNPGYSRQSLSAISSFSNGMGPNHAVSEREGIMVGGSLPPLEHRLKRQPPLAFLTLIAILVMGVGLWFDLVWLTFAGAVVSLLLALRIFSVSLAQTLTELLSPQNRLAVMGISGLVAAAIGFAKLNGWNGRILPDYQVPNWEAIGALGEVFGAIGQIFIAVLAVYIAWRQYVISKDLTIQQNIITQQQTIDSYFQGISELVLDEEGLLEDWPQERAIAEGRTAAILSSVDASGKAKVLRFLSRSRLLSPLQRDRRLGRAILDGKGGYAEDRNYGIRVIDLGVMLAGADLSGTDLRWTDLSDINLIRANLQNADLVKANLARTILCDAILAGSDMMGARLFYGPVATASPRTRADIPNYETGAYTGAVVEGADFSGVKRLSEEQRYYCCAWGGPSTRQTIPGGCEGIPNLLEES